MPLTLLALGAGAAAAALGVAANTGPVLLVLAIGVALAQIVRARTAAHVVCWLVVPLLVWIGHSSGIFLTGTACLFFQAGVAALGARGRPEHATDLAIAVRVSLAVAMALTALALLSFGDIYQ